jgi:hypothetical protein
MNAPPESQVADTVLMVRPAHFFGNSQTAASNAFQQPDFGADRAELLRHARAEFDGLVLALRSRGVRDEVVPARSDVVTPDALFPNNWISFHAGGTVVLYPLLADNRRAEVRPGLAADLATRGPRTGGRTLDLRGGAEADGAVL